MKASYDAEKTEGNELMLVQQEIDVDKFLMELDDEELIDYDFEEKGCCMITNGLSEKIMDKVDNYYPENLNVQIVEDINREIYIKGRQSLMMVYLVLVGLSIFLYSTGIFKELFKIFFLDGTVNI